MSHLFKHTSGCKQKCTQFLTLFSGTVFYALSHGVIRFARSVSPRNHFLTGRNSLTANQKPLLSWFSKLTLRAKWISPCEKAWKNVSENGVRSCVHFCLRSLKRLERCVVLHAVFYTKYSSIVFVTLKCLEWGSQWRKRTKFLKTSNLLKTILNVIFQRIIIIWLFSSKTRDKKSAK